jgi:hypothetical protein
MYKQLKKTKKAEFEVLTFQDLSKIKGGAGGDGPDHGTNQKGGGGKGKGKGKGKNKNIHNV